MSSDIRVAFGELIDEAYRVSADVGSMVEEILKEGRDRPLPLDEAHDLLARLVSVLRVSAERRGDEGASASLGGDLETLVQRVAAVRDGWSASADATERLDLQAHDGIDPTPVLPTPCFHGREIPMLGGFVRTRDIRLWPGNERLEIHLDQFRRIHDREPAPEEILDVMLSKLDMPGIDNTDQFKILELARSIAANGVRKAPIIDVDGTLLDGNRRVAACHLILASPEFDTRDRERAETLYAWQLTEHATQRDRDAVVVSLNFEKDCKEDWPEYVKARKVWDEWTAMLTALPYSPNKREQAKMKRELSKQFALGPDTTVVNRYLKMVSWAQDFEDHQVNVRAKDEYAVKHRANEAFQYFDELSKGEKAGGVAWTLGQDDTFRALVFDLLFDGKFKNWRQIRDLKHIYTNEDARDHLAKARDEKDEDEAEEIVEQAMAIARAARRENRELGANTRIEAFVEWLEQLPVGAFEKTISLQNLRRLLRALELVSDHVRGQLARRESTS